MIYTIKEYRDNFLFSGKKVSTSTIKRRCLTGYMPKNHTPILKGRVWLIVVSGHCGTCKHFTRSNVFKNQGRCHAFDPVINVMDSMSCDLFT